MDPYHYQKFDFLGKKRGDSDSVGKYKLSKLELFPIENKRCLDVGCNAGYFLFKLLPRKPKSLVGIDKEKLYIDLANVINTEHFKSDKFIFIVGDFFTHKFESVFDLIICFSTFHYFGDLQSEFFRKCHSLLAEGGVLLLEVEEYPINEVPMIENSSPRPADKQKYNYPNSLQIEQFVSGRFFIMDRYISVKQGGSLYDRYFYSLRRL